MASRILGVVREQVFAYYFGASSQMDAFNVAFRLPNLVRDLFAEGAMSAAFVPTFTRYLTTRSRADAWQLGRRVMTGLIVVTGVIVVLCIAGADLLTWFYAGSYAEVAGKLELTTKLTRVMFPFLTLVAIAVALMGMLNALGFFFIPALSPAFFNVATILSAVALAPLMPRFGMDPMMGLAIGVILGGLGQIALQWPLLRRQGFRFAFDFAPKDPGVRHVLLLMGPGTAGLAATQINLFVSTWLATTEGTGAVTWLQYAFRLMYLPIGLFGVSVATAAVPALSRHVAQQNLQAVRTTVSSALRLMMMLNVPATVGLIVLAVPIVGLIYERGRFGITDTHAVALALMAYAPGLVGYSAVKVASPTFYALGDSRTPVAISAVAVLCNAALSLALVRVMGFPGLALATALAAVVNAGLLFWLLRRRLGSLDGRRIVVSLVKIGLASIVMGLAALVAHYQLTQVWPGPSLLSQMLRVGASIALALMVLAAASRLLRIEEFQEAFGQVFSKASGLVRKW
jgi:putative peptidoglycan lipid II flippase